MISVKEFYPRAMEIAAISYLPGDLAVAVSRREYAKDESLHLFKVSSVDTEQVVSTTGERYHFCTYSFYRLPPRLPTTYGSLLTNVKTKHQTYVSAVLTKGGWMSVDSGGTTRFLAEDVIQSFTIVKE